MKTAPVNVRLPEALKHRAAVVAQKNHMSLSDAMRLAIIRWLPEMEAGTFALRGVDHESAR